MTIDAGPLRFTRKMKLTLGDYTPRTNRGKKHYERSFETSPILGNNEISKIPKTTRLSNWKPSESLIQFNNKQLLCYIGSNKLKKGMPKTNVNQRSILNMTGVDKKENKRHRKRRLDDAKILNIIRYKDGPKFRQTKLAENINKHNAITRTPEAIRMRQTQFNEYSINKINGTKSHIVFS